MLDYFLASIPQSSVSRPSITPIELSQDPPGFNARPLEKSQNAPVSGIQALDFELRKMDVRMHAEIMVLETLSKAILCPEASDSPVLAPGRNTSGKKGVDCRLLRRLRVQTL